MPDVSVRHLTEADRAWVTPFLVEQAGSPRQVARGHVHQADALPGFAAFVGGRPVGLATYVVRGPECEMATLHAAERQTGAGTALVEAVQRAARQAGCTRLWLITTNDNLDAMRFYQRRGFVIAAVHRGAVDEWRRTLKPEIPVTGNYGIPIRDEIEFEMAL